MRFKCAGIVLATVLFGSFFALSAQAACRSKARVPSSTKSISSKAVLGSQSAASSKVGAPASSSLPTSLSAEIGSSNGPVTVEQLNSANPKAAEESFCNGSSSSGDSGCSTNADAVGPINNAISKYSITRRGEIVGVVANMLFESGGWAENVNANPGQGTRCMMMWNYISTYANELHPKEYASLIGSSAGSPDSASDSVKNKVRELVLNPDDTFASGFWYLVTVATKYHGDESKLRDGNLDDFKDYVENGIVTTWSSAREQWWKEANQFLMV
ncbi:hypothetical protein GGI07_005865 [Coemansia sp. Benny D115]|nr:hypothetical protein GGI07_005865 [Coemansia sp. Benny D115]